MMLYVKDAQLNWLVTHKPSVVLVLSFILPLSDKRTHVQTWKKGGSTVACW